MRTPNTLQRECDNWNETHQVGSAVWYYPVIGDESQKVVAKTRSEAFVLAGHTACVMLSNKSGCVALFACKPLAEARAAK